MIRNADDELMQAMGVSGYTVRGLPELGRKYLLLNVLCTFAALGAGIALFFRAGQRDDVFWALVAVFLAGVAGCILLDRVLIRSIRCATCGQRVPRAKPPRGKLITIQYHCPTCRVVWDTAVDDTPRRRDDYSEPLR